MNDKGETHNILFAITTSYRIKDNVPFRRRTAGRNVLCDKPGKRMPGFPGTTVRVILFDVRTDRNRKEKVCTGS